MKGSYFEYLDVSGLHADLGFEFYRGENPRHGKSVGSVVVVSLGNCVCAVFWSVLVEDTPEAASASTQIIGHGDGIWAVQFCPQLFALVLRHPIQQRRDGDADFFAQSDGDAVADRPRVQNANQPAGVCGFDPPHRLGLR